MSWNLPPGEPSVESWEIIELSQFSRSLLDRPDFLQDRPQILAVDGRGASGKSTLARSICSHIASSAIVHTDDVAWHEPYFGWWRLLRDHVLRPVHDGLGVSFTPPMWPLNDRSGAIEVEPGLQLLVVEGTGAARAATAGLVDTIIWVQSDFAHDEARGIARDTAAGVNGDKAETVAFWYEWMAEELTFFDRDLGTDVQRWRQTDRRRSADRRPLPRSGTHRSDSRCRVPRAAATSRSSGCCSTRRGCRATSCWPNSASTKPCEASYRSGTIHSHGRGPTTWHTPVCCNARFSRRSPRQTRPSSELMPANWQLLIRQRPDISGPAIGSSSRSRPGRLVKGCRNHAGLDRRHWLGLDCAELSDRIWL